jgi:hypothetical protein
VRSLLRNLVSVLRKILEDQSVGNVVRGSSVSSSSYEYGEILKKKRQNVGFIVNYQKSGSRESFTMNQRQEVGPLLSNVRSYLNQLLNLYEDDILPFFLGSVNILYTAYILRQCWEVG